MVGLVRFEATEPPTQNADGQVAKRSKVMSDTQIQQVREELPGFLSRFDDLEQRHRQTLFALLFEQAGPETWAVAKLYLSTVEGGAA